MAKSLVLSFLFILFFPLAISTSHGFVFNGFKNAFSNLTLSGSSVITPHGALQITNFTKNLTGHAFYYKPCKLLDKESSNSPRVYSFATTFVFSIVTALKGGTGGGHGFAFTIAPSTEFYTAASGNYLGLFNATNNGNSSNHVFAIEFDTVKALEHNDINDNHVGIDINSVRSNASKAASYYDNVTRSWKDIELESDDRIQVWIDYDGNEKVVNVTIAPIFISKPSQPLLSKTIDLSMVIKEFMFVGFSAATQKLASAHYILGWSFEVGSTKPELLNLHQIPKIPKREGASPSFRKRGIEIGAISVVATLVLFLGLVLVLLVVLRKAKLADSLEEWELQFPHRLRYKDLYIATKGFKESRIVGVGGFGSVYRGVLPKTKEEIAVKRISHDSRQGLKEFIAEVASLGKLRHRNLVHLQGWCKKKNDLFLVYDYMSNGSLDRFLFEDKRLAWVDRFRIVKEVASGLLYLHEEWEEVVVHRDVKANNVLLDSNMTAKLGDFGLAKLYEHGKDPTTTHVVGTIGYIAPELSHTGKATTSSDVYAFGALLLEVACGRRPLELIVQHGQLPNLQDWVSQCYQRGNLIDVADPKLENVYSKEEMELVLKLGLLCSYNAPEARPSMLRVTRYLNRVDPLPDIVVSNIMSDTYSTSSSTYCYTSSYGVISTGSLGSGR